MLDSLAHQYIQKFVERLEINLEGMCVLTEIGTAGYLYSSLIALESGAEKVIAVAPDNRYATHQELRKSVLERVDAWDLPKGRIEILRSKAEIKSNIDVIFNLGNVRPIDSQLLDCCSQRAVVSYMCEKWEFRDSDIDIEYCKKLGIPVAGVYEDYDNYNIFMSCGQLAIKLLFDAGISVNGCKIGLFGNNKFCDVIFESLNSNHSDCVRFLNSSELTLLKLEELEAIVIAEYSHSRNVLEDMEFSIQDLAQINPNLKIVSFAGSIDVAEFLKYGFDCFPRYALDPLKMYKTLDYLGIRPVIALHAMGIKVGELLFRKKNQGRCFGSFANLVQEFF